MRGLIVPAVAVMFVLGGIGGIFAPQGLAVKRLDAPPPARPQPPCLTRYKEGAVLLETALAAEIVQGHRALADYIKSVSGRRYWGLSDHLVLRKGETGAPPLQLDYLIPKGSINPGNKQAPRGGAGFLWQPQALPEGVSRACLGYRLRFAPGFDFVKGGKLPGLFGGMGPSGGRKVTGGNGFSTRFMWRRKGDGEVYAYIVGNDRRGVSLDRGAWRFVPGRWMDMQQEVILNTPGKADGRVRVWVDGRQVMDHGGLVFRTGRDIFIRGVMAHVFFGGKQPSWASTADTRVSVTPFRLAWEQLAPIRAQAGKSDQAQQMEQKK